MADAYIFSGPTLPPPVARVVELGNGNRVHFLPPVAEGDIMALVPHKPAVIGIVDGYFENVPVVWHKEILFAMAQGIHVIGAASMGALRAAELALFGMEGVGAIFQDFAEGRLEDDDEVTVAHGPAELGFPALSEAMVNIRRTFDDARAAGVLSVDDHAALLKAGKDLYYKDRDYGRIMSLAPGYGVPEEVLQALGAWLVTGRQNQKSLDARALVDEVMRRMENGLLPQKKVMYNFESTAIWEHARRRV